MPEQVVEDPVLKHRLKFSHSTDEDGTDVAVVEMWVEPGGGVPPHVHPAMEERFTVISGTAEFLSGRKWQSAGPGEVAVVPPGTRHAYRNRGDEVAHVVCEARPGLSLEEFMTDAAALSKAGKLTKAGIPKSPSAVLEGVALAHRHREMVTLGFPMPPAFFQRLLFPPLARLAARRGYGPAA